MTQLPALQAEDVIRALKRFGFIEDRQKGSHLVMLNLASGARTVIPVHPGKTIKKGLLFAILKDAKLTPEEFLKVL